MDGAFAAVAGRNRELNWAFQNPRSAALS